MFGGLIYECPEEIEFTLSKENGFTLSEGKLQITIWLNNANGKKEALGNVTINVINTTVIDDGDIIISGDVNETLVNFKVELQNLQTQTNNTNAILTNKADKVVIDGINNTIKQIKTDVLGKVNHVDSTEPVVYASDNGMDITIPVQSYPTEYNQQSIVVRDANGVIYGEVNVNADNSLVNVKHINKIVLDFNNKISQIPKFTIEVVEALPTENIGIGTLYLVKNSELTNQLYQEWIYINDSWELLGSAKIDLTDFVTKEYFEENSEVTETFDIGTSESYDETSDTQVPTTKAVKEMLGNSSGASGKLYLHKFELSALNSTDSNIKITIYFNLYSTKISTAITNVMQSDFDSITGANYETSYICGYIVQSNSTDSTSSKCVGNLVISYIGGNDYNYTIQSADGETLISNTGRSGTYTLKDKVMEV